MGGLRWLFICCDGWGLGHVARLIGLARNIRKRQPDGEFLFLTDSEASILIWQEGFASVKLPCYEFPKMGTRVIGSAINEDVVRSVVGPVITAYRPDVVVADTFPFGYRNEYASLQFFRGRKVLLYREVGESKRNRLYEIGVRSFDLILLPYVQGGVDPSLPRGLRAPWVGPSWYAHGPIRCQGTLPAPAWVCRSTDVFVLSVLAAAAILNITNSWTGSFRRRTGFPTGFSPSPYRRYSPDRRR